MFGFRHNNIFVYHDILNSMDFYIKNSNNRMIKIFKFLKRIKSDNFEELSQISLSLGHKLKENEMIDFITNVVSHFNPLYQERDFEISNYVSNCFEEIKKIILHPPPTFFQV